MAEKFASNKERPLAGVVLCFTSISPEQRTELASIAGQMGATHQLDLTSDVTHLLIGETSTPKYKFVARERADVIVVKPEWVEAVRQSWIQGGDTDIRALEQKYKFPTFMGLAICITGFEDTAFRNYIQKSAVALGADFRGDLTKSVTHLIARSTEGEKYKFATQWNTKVVTIKWFTDSIERGMALEETLYHPLVPAEQQGAGAWNRSVSIVRGKSQDNENSANPRPRKLRRIASAKLGDQNEGIWGDIVGSGFEPGDIGRPRESQQKNENRTSKKSAPIIQEAKSFASETTFAEAQGSRQQSSQATATRRTGFLDECYFLIHGFSSKQSNVLRHHLTFNGAQVVNSLSEFSRPDIPKRGHGLYIIAPYKTSRSAAPSTEDQAFECEIVTDMWLERCLDAKALVPPESHVANTPIPSFPLSGFSGMKICSTGFSRIDLLHLSKLVSLIGASYNEYLTPKASVLICNDSIPTNHEKLRHTSEWGVPAVTIEWLWASIRSERKQPFDSYLILKPPTQSSKDLELRAGSRPGPRTQPENTNKSNNPTPQNQPQEPPIKREQEREPSQISASTSQRKNKSEPTSKPASPTKPPPSLQNGTRSSPSMKRKLSDQSTTPSAAAAQSAIDLAMSGFLKQARAATSRSTSETGEGHERIRSRRAKPLLGRAQSNSSVRTIEQRAFSRASSTDTLNEDGCGSAIESINTDGIPSLANSGRFEYAEGERVNSAHNESENETPPMTQLGYEDPDAVAMREKFLRGAGKLADKPLAKEDSGIGEVKELEEMGWGTGRRTRNANKAVVDVDEY